MNHQQTKEDSPNFPEDQKVDLSNPMTQLLYNSDFKIHKEKVNSRLQEKFKVNSLDAKDIYKSSSIVNRDPERRLSNAHPTPKKSKHIITSEDNSTLLDIFGELDHSLSHTLKK